MPRRHQLENWEVALIKAMLQKKTFKKQVITSYFSRPNRSINPARISEIESDHERYKKISPASAKQLDDFLKHWDDLTFPTSTEDDLSPVHPKILTRKFLARADAPEKLNVSETSEVEAKEKFDWGSSEKYCKTLAGMANNKGGYILFGVIDASFEIKGIANDRMEKFDLAKVHQFVSKHFNQHLDVEKGQFEVNDKTIGVLYVHPLENKPIIRRVTKKGAESGDIYFRYPGETRKIQEPELNDILSQRDRKIEKRLSILLKQITTTGLQNSALLDLGSGTIQGQSGTFSIDENLLDKVKFIAEGKFSEKEGSPTLRLVGDVKPVTGDDNNIIEHEVAASITERDIQEAFLSQTCAHDPKSYIQAQPNLQPKWFPIYFFAVKGAMDLKNLVDTLKGAKTDYPSRTKTQVERIEKDNSPTALPAQKTVEKELDRIYGDGLLNVSTEQDATNILKALLIVDTNKVDFARILEILRPIWALYRNNESLKTNFRYTLAALDRAYFRDKIL